jgi:hypothetical protein
MRSILKRRPSPSMVVAFIALLLALGSGAYAQMNIPNNSVGTNKLRNNAVTTNKINNGAVTTQKIRNSAVTTQKIRNGAVNSNKVRNGSLMSADFMAGQLPRGPAGPAGAAGPPGPPGATNVTVVESAAAVSPVAVCPPGRVATGGGGVVAGDPPPDSTWYLYASYPIAAVPGGPPTAWTVQAADTGPPAGPPQPARAYVVCAAP